MDQDFVSFQQILFHPQTQIRIIPFDDEPRDIPNLNFSQPRFNCELGGIVGGDEGPIGGVAQVDCHGVKVVGVHGEEGQVKDGEVQGEVKRVEQLRDNRASWMVWRWDDGLKRP